MHFIHSQDYVLRQATIGKDREDMIHQAMEGHVTYKAQASILWFYPDTTVFFQRNNAATKALHV